MITNTMLLEKKKIFFNIYYIFLLFIKKVRFFYYLSKKFVNIMREVNNFLLDCTYLCRWFSM